MGKKSREEADVYVIPPNFIEGGKLFGGMFKMRNTEVQNLTYIILFKKHLSHFPTLN